MRSEPSPTRSRHAGAAHGHWTDAGQDLALGRMPGANQPLAAVVGQLVGMASARLQPRPRRPAPAAIAHHCAKPVPQRVALAYFSPRRPLWLAAHHHSASPGARPALAGAATD